MPDDLKPYAVGYCSPPRETQWKKGQSGNPRGRRPKPKQTSLNEDVRRALSQPVKVRKANGSVQRTPALAAAVQQLVQRALVAKDLKELALCIKLAREVGILGAAASPPESARTGAVVLREPARSVEAWLEETGAYRVPTNPLEGLPGFDARTNTMNGLSLDGPARKGTPEDED